jgi:hypothetical protein
MAGDEQINSPKDFNECVSRAQLQAAMEESQRGMNDAIKKAITDALIDLKLGSSIERLDRRISALTDKVTELENRLPNEDGMGGNNTDEDAIFDKDGNIDVASTRTAMLRCREKEWEVIDIKVMPNMLLMILMLSLLCLQRRNCKDMSSKARASPPPPTCRVQRHQWG